MLLLLLGNSLFSLSLLATSKGIDLVPKGIGCALNSLSNGLHGREIEAMPSDSDVANMIRSKLNQIVVFCILRSILPLSGQGLGIQWLYRSMLRGLRPCLHKVRQ